MRKAITAGAVAIGLTVLLAGCGQANSVANNATGNTANSTATATTNSTGSAVTTDMKKQFVAVTASAQSAIDDFVTGNSMLGAMDTKKIGGTDYAVVATSKTDLDSLENSYLDFLTQAQVNNLFGHVTQKNGLYVFQPVKSSGDTSDWFKATVTSVAKQDNGYLVTLSVPQTGGSSAQTKTALIVKDSSGHWVYAGT